MVKVSIEPKILEWAMNRSNKTELLHKNFKFLTEWLTGKKEPTLKQLELFANATNTPLGYFFLKDVPTESLPVPHYRTTTDRFNAENSSPELIDTIYAMQRRQDFMKEYLEENIVDSLDFIGIYKGNDPIELAILIRKILELPERWALNYKSFDEALKCLINRCEVNFITVMVNGIVGNNTSRKLDVEEFRGFVLVDRVAPLIFINGADAKSAQVFTLIHEVAHLIIGSSAIVEASPLNTSTEDVEELCNKAAVEFLCPEKLYLTLWNENEYEPIVELSRKLKVSRVVIARRALEIQILDYKEFKLFYDEYKKEIINRVKKESTGGNFYYTAVRKLGTLFSDAIIYKVNNKTIQYTDAYKLTGMKAHTFHKYVKHYTRGGY